MENPQIKTNINEYILLSAAYTTRPVKSMVESHDRNAYKQFRSVSILTMMVAITLLTLDRPKG